MYNQTQNYTTADHIIEDCLLALQKSHAGKVAVHFHLSRFLPYNRQPFQVAEAAQNARKSFGTSLHDTLILKNNDILCIIENSSPIQIERGIIYYKKSFTVNDPLLKTDLNQERFYTLYDLGHQWQDFERIISHIQIDNVLPGVVHN